jgi:phytoene desaturase
MMTKNNNDKNQTVVIGGGIGGIAIALLLRAQGRDVVLVEKTPQLGGIAANFASNTTDKNAVRGFYPLGFGDYSIFAKLFTAHHKKVEDYVDVIHQKNMLTRFIYDNKDYLELADLDYSLAKMRNISADHARQYQQLYDFSKRLHQLLEEISAGAKASSLFSKLGLIVKIFKALPVFPYLRLSYGQVVEKFIKDEKVQMAFNYRTSLLGETAYTTSSFYIMMLHMQEIWGSFTAPGGIEGLVLALEKLMQDVGITVIKGNAVTALRCEDRVITEVVLQSGATLRCSTVISNITPYHLYGSLLPERYGSKARALLENVKYTPSVFSYHFKTRRCYSDTPPMMVIFPSDFKKFWAQIYENAALPDELLLGVYRSNYYDDSFVDADTDHFCVYLTTPNLQANIDWEAISEPLVAKIIDRLEAYLLPDLSKNIIDGFYRTPLDMQSQCSLPYGAAFGPQVSKIYRGKDLFANTEPDLDNLYLVGHNTLPGAGLNAALMSAEFVADKLCTQ